MIIFITIILALFFVMTVEPIVFTEDESDSEME